MSSEKKESGSMPIRIDNDVREWIEVLKDAYDSPSVSDALRRALRKAHPNIEEIAARARKKDNERAAVLKGLEGLGNGE